MASWRIEYPTATGTTTDNQITSVEVVDAYNRFARSATVELVNPAAKRDTFTPFTPVTVQVMPSGGSWMDLLGGFVVDPATDRNLLVLNILSHDLWLRRREVFASYSSTAISTILNDLIQDFTPLTWDSSLVTVENDITMSRSWKGETLDTIIGELSSRSADEVFGGTNDAKFFFRPSNNDYADRNFVPGEFFDAEFQEDGADEINKVTVYYGEGDNTAAVSVQDRASQRDIQDKGNFPRAVVNEVTRNYPNITSEEAAEQKAWDILKGRSTIQTGEVRSWAGWSLSPGDITRVRVPDQGVDTEFRIAEVRWRNKAGSQETKLRLAENEAGVIDTLANMSKEVSRIDAKQADETATVNEIVPLGLPMNVNLSMEAYTRTIPSDQFLFGQFKGGFGDPDIGGGRLGDQRGDPTQVI